MNNQNNPQHTQSINEVSTPNSSSDLCNSYLSRYKRRNAICVTLQDANRNLVNNTRTNSDIPDKQ